MTLTFGEIMIRLCPEEKYMLCQAFPGKLESTFGGAEANVAVSLANFGMPARFLSALPDNVIGKACVAQLRGIGVDTSFVKMAENSRIGIYYMEHGANQRASKVVYDRANSAICNATVKDFDFKGALNGVKRVHLSGITPAISESAAECCVELAKLAHEAGAKVSVDLNFRGKLWKWKKGTAPRELARSVMPEILKYANLVIGNEEDAFDVLGIESGKSDVGGGKLDFDAYVETARKIAKKFKSVEKVSFTLRQSFSATHNNWGAMLFDAKSDKAVFAPTVNGEYAPYEIKAIVDRVGGGDSFAAGLIYGLYSGDFSSDADALAFAVAASCLAHSIRGDFNFAQKSDVLALMKGGASGRVQR